MTDYIDDVFDRLLAGIHLQQKEKNPMNRKLEIKILIRTDEGKQQEFTLSSVVENPDIQLGAVAWAIETAINEHTKFRAHADIKEP